MSDQKEQFATVFLNNIGEIKPLHFQSLIRNFESAALAVESDVESWVALEGFDIDLVEKIKTKWESAKQMAFQEWEFLEKKKIKVLLWQSDNYPQLLHQISSAPPIIYGMGEDIAGEQATVAMVGTRHPTYYGQKMAKTLAGELAEAGVITVSGLARGIDSCVHHATLEAKGKTWAVIGSGLNVLYPPENSKLAGLIEKGGAVLSEFPFNTPPLQANFPRRNRIIAGLSYATVVVEGRERSGSLITARLAVEEGRDVFAVPGPVTSPMSAAPHYLIRLGAKLIENAQDILEELPENIKTHLKGFVQKKGGLAGMVSGDHQKILKLLGGTPVPKESISDQLRIPPGELSALLLDMELRGLIASLSGGMLVKK